jgi:hypothetical protein
MLPSMAGGAHKTREEGRDGLGYITKRTRFLADGSHHRILAAMHTTTGPDRPARARLLEEGGRKNARH